MKATELRIGNWFIGYDNKPFQWDLNHFSMLAYEYNAPEVDELIKGPVLLTEEIRLKCGFEKINHINGYSFCSLSKSRENKCHIEIYENTTRYMGYSVKHCEYLHQLQNLYFCICGEELEVKL